MTSNASNKRGEPEPFNSGDLLGILGVLLNSNAPIEMREDALEEMIINWSIGPEIAEILRGMVAKMTFEDEKEILSLYCMIAIRCCPDYTWTNFDIEIPFQDPLTGKETTRRVTMGLIVEPGQQSSTLSAKKRENNFAQDKNRLH